MEDGPISVILLKYHCSSLGSFIKEEIHTRILKNLKEREKYSLQNSAKMMKIG